MSIMPPGSDSKPYIPPCNAMDCPNPGTIFGVYDDGDTQARVNYCPECAGYLHHEFTPISSTTLDLRSLIVAALPLPGEVMTPETWARVVDDLLMPQAEPESWAGE